MSHCTSRDKKGTADCVGIDFYLYFCNNSSLTHWCKQPNAYRRKWVAGAVDVCINSVSIERCVGLQSISNWLSFHQFYFPLSGPQLKHFARLSRRAGAFVVFIIPKMLIFCVSIQKWLLLERSLEKSGGNVNNICFWKRDRASAQSAVHIQCAPIQPARLMT